MSQVPPVGDDTRHHIIQSLFARYDQAGTAEETLISFVKVYEDEGGNEGQKTRYLILAVTKLGKVVVHKAKRNNNLSFSKGKTWQLEDMQKLEVIHPTSFSLTMTVRRYEWTTERTRDQVQFLNAVVKVYKTYTKGNLPELVNFNFPAGSSSSASGSTPGPEAGQQGGQYRGPSPAIPSPARQNMELAPPPRLRDYRSGSNSSLASGASGSNYMSERSMSYTSQRPNLEDSRTPTQASFGRSPLGEQAVLPGMASNRSNGGEAGMRRPSGQAPGGINGGGSGAANGTVRGLGLGLPPPVQRSSSGDRLAPGPSGGIGGAGGARTRTASNESGHGPLKQRVSSEALRRQVSPEALGSVTEESPIRAQAFPDDATQRYPGSNSNGMSGSLAPAPNQYVDVFHDDDDTSHLKSGSGNTIPPPPVITHTVPSPAMPSGPSLSVPHAGLEPPHSLGLGGKNKISRRASFHPPPLNTAFSREVLLTSRTGVLPGAAGLTVDDGEEGQEAIMNNVEEMLEGFDWTVTTFSNGVEGGRKKGSADAIESRLLDELSALDSANIHAFLESDDRIAQVLGHIDEALLELDDIDLQITGYKMQLNAVSEDISFIESQNRGLQVQTSNQQALLDELRQLLQIVEVPQEDLRILTQESPGSARGVQNLERAAASLYKALQAGMDSANAEVAATIARMREYQENSAAFCKRLFDYLDITFRHQSDSTMNETRRSGRKGTLAPHTAMGEYLMTYEGLVLYIKEMDEERYQRLCLNYMSTISQLHQSEIKDLLMGFMGQVNSVAGGDGADASFASAATSVVRPSALQKSKAAIGMRGNDATSKEKSTSARSLLIAELYQKALTEAINQMVTEEDFINAFLHLTDTESTFADHMELDSYFRRQAARHASRGMSVGLTQLVRSMMDLVFGFVDQEFKNWVDAAVDKDPLSIVGVIVVTERVAGEAESENTSIFFTQLFERQLARQRAVLDGFIMDQIRVIEGAKSSVKKRKGSAFFIRHFPTFVERIEAQLDGAGGLPIRAKVDATYERIVNTIFGSVQQLAKTDRGDGQAAEDKGQLNYHVIMIENMRHFIDDVGAIQSAAMEPYMERARGAYDENLNQYIKLLLRRAFGRLIDFFDNVEKLLQNTPANEVSLHPSCSKSALKKVLKDYNAKDMRKSVESMAKRVDKHFNSEDDSSSTADPSAQAVITFVWNEITSQLKSETGKIQEMIGRSYSDSNLGIEYGPNEVEAACRKAKGSI